MCEKDPLNTGEENEGDQEGQGRETIRPQLNYWAPSRDEQAVIKTWLNISKQAMKKQTKMHLQNINTTSTSERQKAKAHLLKAAQFQHICVGNNVSYRFKIVYFWGESMFT